MSVSFKVAQPADEALFDRTANGLFDRTIDASLVREFLMDTRHHIAVATDEDILVGFVTGVDYVHPDKPRQLWINEVAVAPSYCRRGIGSRLMQTMLEHAREMRCAEAWVLADPANEAADALYRSVSRERKLHTGLQNMYAFQLG